MDTVEAPDWVMVFQLLLIRSGGLCEARTERCLAPGGVLVGMPRDRLSIQHRRARGMGGSRLADTHNLANLLAVCGSGVTGCHGWIECQERAAAEVRGLWVRHEYREGVPVPVEEYPLVLWSGRRVLLHPTSPTYVAHPDPWNTQARLARDGGNG